MPLHTLGASSVRHSLWGFTKGDAFSIITCVLFFWLPGIDHRAVWQWVVDHVFFGSVPLASVLGVFVSHKCLEWGGMLFYTLLYAWESKKLPGWRRLLQARCDVQQRPWGWQDKDVEVSKKNMDLQKRSLKYIITFHAVVTVVQFLILASMMQFEWKEGGVLDFHWEWIKGDPELSRADPATIPDKWTVAYQCLVSTCVAETGFYWGHRLLHETRLYYWHKRHHEFNDANNLTVYAAFYVGLLDATITDFFWAGFGVFYFRMHVWTTWMYTLPLILNAIRVHCGYVNERFVGVDPTVTLPLCTDVERTHALHHSHNNCNYGGALFLWDRIMGTWKCPDLYAEEVKREAAVQPASAAEISEASHQAKGAATTDSGVRTRAKASKA